MHATTTRNLGRRRSRILRRIAESKVTVEAIEAELIRRGITPLDYKSSKKLSLPGFRQGEMGKLCLTILCQAGAPMKITEIVNAIAAMKGLDLAGSPSLAKAVRHCVNGALGATNRRGITQLVGLTTSKQVQWTLANLDS